MAETKVNNTYDPYDPSLWVIDDSYPYSLSDLKDFPLSKELEEEIEAIANEMLGPRDGVQSAA